MGRRELRSKEGWWGALQGPGALHEMPAGDGGCPRKRYVLASYGTREGREGKGGAGGGVDQAAAVGQSRGSEVMGGGGEVGLEELCAVGHQEHGVMDKVSGGLLFVIRRLRMGNLAFRGVLFLAMYPFYLRCSFSGVIVSIVQIVIGGEYNCAEPLQKIRVCAEENLLYTAASLTKQNACFPMLKQ